MFPKKFLCGNQKDSQCHAQIGGWDATPYFTAGACYGHNVSPAGTTTVCPRYLPSFLTRDNTPVTRIKMYDTPFTVPSEGIRLEFNDGETSPTRTYPEDAADKAVVPLVAWYAESGYHIGVVPVTNGRYGIKYWASFYAPEAADYQFLFAGVGEVNFTIAGAYRIGADATDYDTLSKDQYTSTGAITLTQGWHTFEVRYRRVDVRQSAGLAVLWRNDTTFTKPTVLSAGAASYNGTWLTGTEVKDYSNLSVSRSEDADISEATFDIPLGKSSDARGYYYDSATRTFVHNNGGPSLKPNRLYEIETGFEVEGTKEYRKILTGHLMSTSPSRSANGVDRVRVSVRDFGHLLRSAHVENWPDPLIYWISGYLGSSRPDGGSYPPAWDAWELDRVVDALCVMGGIDPMLLRARRLYFDEDESVAQGDAMIQKSHPPVILESKASYGNPNVILKLSDQGQKEIDESYYWGVEFGEKILDAINKLVDNYGWEFGFVSGYDILPGTLDFGGGPFLKVRGNHLYFVNGLNDWNMIHFGGFEGDVELFNDHLKKTDQDNDTPEIDTSVVNSGSQSLRFANQYEAVKLGSFQVQRDQVYAITFEAYYDAGGAFTTDMALRAKTGWHLSDTFDTFHYLDGTLFERTDNASTDITGDSVWRKYKVVFTAQEDGVIDLEAEVNTALQASSNLYIDDLAMISLLDDTYSIKAFEDYTDSTFVKQHPSAIMGEYFQADIAGNPSKNELRLPFKGTRVDLITVPGADLTASTNHIRARVFRASDLTIVADHEGNDYDVTIEQYHEAPNSDRDEWFYHDGVDDTGVNPCVTKVADNLPYDDYYLLVDFLTETPRLDGIMVFTIDPGTASHIPGFENLTVRTKADASEPFTPGTIGGLDAEILSQDQRNDVMVIGASLGLWVPDEYEGAVVDPNNPVEERIFARVVDRDAIFNSDATNFIGRRVQTVVIEPGISSNDRAKWVANYIISQNQLVGQKISPSVIHNPLLDIGDQINVVDDEKGIVHSGTVTVRGVDTNLGANTTDRISADSFAQPGSYVPRHKVDLGAHGNEFLKNTKMYNNGYVIGTLKNAMTNTDTSCVVSLHTDSDGGDVDNFPDRGYFIVTNTSGDRTTWEIIHYSSITRDSVGKEVTLTWTDNALHRGLEYRQRQLADDDETWLNDTSPSAVAHSAGVTVYAPYDPYLSEEYPPQRVQFEAELVQPGYLRVEIHSKRKGDESRAPHTLVAVLTNSDTETTETTGTGERFFDPGKVTFSWDGVANEIWNETTNHQKPSEEQSTGGFYAAEYGPPEGWTQPSAAGGIFAEDDYATFFIRVSLRTLDGVTYSQELGPEFHIFTRRGPKLDTNQVRWRLWAHGSEWGAGSTGQTTITYPSIKSNVPGTRFVSGNNVIEGKPHGLVVALQRIASTDPDYITRAEGDRRMQYAALEDIVAYRYVEIRRTVSAVNSIYSGLKEFKLGSLKLRTLNKGEREWRFSYDPVWEDFSYEGHVYEALDEKGQDKYNEYEQEKRLSVWGAWYFEFQPIVIDRSGRRADLDPVLVQWCGDGRKYTAEYVTLDTADAFTPRKLVPAVSQFGVGKEFEVRTEVGGKKRKIHAWVHRIYLTG